MTPAIDQRPYSLFTVHGSTVPHLTLCSPTQSARPGAHGCHPKKVSVVSLSLSNGGGSFDSCPLWYTILSYLKLGTIVAWIILRSRRRAGVSRRGLDKIVDVRSRFLISAGAVRPGSIELIATSHYQIGKAGFNPSGTPSSCGAPVAPEYHTT